MPKPRQLSGLTVVPVPELRVCDGCAFNSRQFENAEGGCVVSNRTQKRCSVDKIIYIKPEDYPQHMAQWAALKLEK